MSSTDGGAIPSSFRIDPLAGAENYTAWSTKVKDLLTGLGLEEQITSSKPVTISEFTKNRFVQWAPKGPFSSVTQKSTNCGNTLYNDLYKPPSN